MSEEQRLHDRESLIRTDFPGNFAIEIGEERHIFTRVNDVSISGMGIHTDIGFEIGDEVVIKYTSAEFTLAIKALIAWSVKEGDKDYKVGVKFSSEDLDANVMLFMTLREYIDDFGEAF